MPIDISCPGCNRRMSVPEAAAGRQVKCPGCQTPVVVPTAAPVAVPSPAAAATSRPAPAARPAPAVARPAPAVARAMPQAERWTLLTEDQQQFGPIARVELDQWYAEGRITQSCQLLREGGAAWQWATDVYPALAGPAMMSQPANEFDFGSPAANPYAPSKPTKSSVSKYTRRSAAVDYVSYACFAVIGLIALNILMGGLMQHSQISDRVDPGLASASLAVYYGVGFLVALIVIIPYGLAGVAVSGRKQWGRILCFVCAGFSVLFGLINGVVLAIRVLAYAALSSRIPDEAHGPILFTLFLSGLMLLTWITHAGLSFIVLANSRFAKEFR